MGKPGNKSKSSKSVCVEGCFYVHTRPDVGRWKSRVHTEGHIETFPTAPMRHVAVLFGCRAVEHGFQKVSSLYS